MSVWGMVEYYGRLVAIYLGLLASIGVLGALGPLQSSERKAASPPSTAITRFR